MPDLKHRVLDMLSTVVYAAVVSGAERLPAIAENKIQLPTPLAGRTEVCGSNKGAGGLLKGLR
jgi:hypothetical protein